MRGFVRFGLIKFLLFELISRAFFAALREVLKPGGQIFVIAVTDHVLKRSFRRMHKDGSKWSKNVTIDAVLADYTHKPTEYLPGILEGMGYAVDLCQETRGDCVAENLPGK